MTRYGRFKYEGAVGPARGAQPGTVALMEWAVDRFDRASNLGIFNPRRIGGSTAWSVHAEGRAGDIGFPVVRTGHPQGNQCANILVGAHQELGVQQVIWHRKVWRVGREGWRPYSGRSPHTDHIHVEQSWEAARTLTADMIRETFHTPTPKLETTTMAAHADLLAVYLMGGRPGPPSPTEAQAWLADMKTKRDEGKDLWPTLDYILWAVAKEPKGEET